MNGFDNRPNPELMRERMEKLRRVKLDLRGVGWTMLASELIHTWLSVFIMGVLVAQRIAPEIGVTLTDAVNSEPRRGKSWLSVLVRLSERLRFRLFEFPLVIRKYDQFFSI